MGIYQKLYEADENLENDLEDMLEDSGQYEYRDAKQHLMLSELKRRGMICWWEEYVTRQEWPIERLLKLFKIDHGRVNQLAASDPERARKLLLSAIMRFLRRREKLVYYNYPEQVAGLIQKARNILVLTGAGISVSCGIPDFRSRDGIYAEIRESNDYDLDDPQQMFDIHYFKHDPSMFYSFAHKIYPLNYEPSPTHFFIRALDAKGKLLRNYTQNIDALESKAGVSRVVQCHGSFATAYCIQCRATVPGSDIEKEILLQTVPICKRCDRIAKQGKGKTKKRKRRCWEDDNSEDEVDYPPHVMKPGITFFGESLSSTFDVQLKLDRDNVDLLIIIGTSLNVAPVSEIICHIPHQVPQILINKTMIKHAQPDIALLGDSDEIVKSIYKHLDWLDCPKEAQLKLQSNQIYAPQEHLIHPHIHLFKGADESSEDRLIPDPPLSTVGIKTAPIMAEKKHLDRLWKSRKHGSDLIEDIYELSEQAPADLSSKSRPIDITAIA